MAVLLALAGVAPASAQVRVDGDTTVALGVVLIAIGLVITVWGRLSDRGTSGRKEFWAAIHAEREQRLTLERSIAVKFELHADKSEQGRAALRAEIREHLNTLQGDVKRLGSRMDEHFRNGNGPATNR